MNSKGNFITANSIDKSIDLLHPNGKQSGNKRTSDSSTHLTILETNVFNVLADLAKNEVVGNLQLNKKLLVQNSTVKKLNGNEQSLKTSVHQFKLTNADLNIRNSTLEEDVSK